jgi:hypothetical protein
MVCTGLVSGSTASQQQYITSHAPHAPLPPTHTTTCARTPGQVYTDTKSLRYGHLMIMTDQDHDGSHIKGLIMNFFHTFYPSLLKLPGFLVEFITPIIKVRAAEAVDMQDMLRIWVCGGVWGVGGRWDHSCSQI